jgi:hypothetical protein
MAMMKKKMAAKSAMMKKKSPMRKAQKGTSVGGVTLSYNPDTDEKNALTIEKPKELGEVKAKPSFKQDFAKNMRNFMSIDSDEYQNSKAKTTAGKILRGANKAASIAARAVASPLTTAVSAMDAGVKSVKNAIDKRKTVKAIKNKMGGKVTKKVAPKMMMKKMSKKK